MLTSLRTLALLAVLAGASPAAARPMPEPAAAQPFRLGNLRLFVLRDAGNVVANDGRTFGLGRPPSEVAGVAGTGSNPIELSVDALLVEGNGAVMLFDTGLGPPAHGVLLQSLAQAGVRAEQVTDVFITHSHGDHIGGLLRPDGSLAFPNAAIRMSEREWAYLRGDPAQAALARTIAPRVRPFTLGDRLPGGVEALDLPGHTPGHTGYRISSHGLSLIDIGDTAHSSVVSLARPDWLIGYDADKAAGRATRQAELARLADSGQLVFAPHFPFPGVGRIVRQGAAFAWRPGLS